MKNNDVYAQPVTVFDYLRTIASYVVASICGIIFFIPCFILVAILPGRYRYNNRVIFWLLHCTYKSILWATWLPITIEGIENITNTPSIIAPNHLSSLDIPLVGSLLGVHPHIWFVYIRFAKMPFLGFFIRRMNVPVDMEGRSTLKSLRDGIRLLEGTNRHAVIFPEAGRFEDGEIHEFFGGFALLAKATKRPVVPVRLYNLEKIYPRGSFLMYKHPIKVIVGKPFVFDEQNDTLETFNVRVRQWFLDLEKI